MANRVEAITEDDVQVALGAIEYTIAECANSKTLLKEKALANKLRRILGKAQRYCEDQNSDEYGNTLESWYNI